MKSPPKASASAKSPPKASASAKSPKNPAESKVEKPAESKVEKDFRSPLKNESNPRSFDKRAHRKDVNGAGPSNIRQNPVP